MSIKFRELELDESSTVTAVLDVSIPVTVTEARDAFGNLLVLSGIGPDLRLIAWGKEGLTKENATTRHWISVDPVTPDVLVVLFNSAFTAGEQAARQGFRGKLLKLFEL